MLLSFALLFASSTTELPIPFRMDRTALVGTSTASGGEDASFDAAGLTELADAHAQAAAKRVLRSGEGGY